MGILERVRPTRKLSKNIDKVNLVNRRDISYEKICIVIDYWFI